MRHNPPRKPGRPQTFRQPRRRTIILDKYQDDYLVALAKREKKSVSEIIVQTLFSKFN